MAAQVRNVVQAGAGRCRLWHTEAMKLLFPLTFLLLAVLMPFGLSCGGIYETPRLTCPEGPATVANSDPCGTSSTPPRGQAPEAFAPGA